MTVRLICGCRLRSRYIVRGCVPLHVPAVHLNYADKEHGEQGDKQKGEGKYVLVGEVSHKWQPCSTSNDRIVK